MNIINAMAAGTQSGTYGACLFILDWWGSLWFTTQESPGGSWQAWQGPNFGGQPKPGRAIACAGQNNGCLMLAMLDKDGMVWTMQQEHPSGGWGHWQGPGIGGQPQPFATITAAEASGPRGIQLTAADGAEIWHCYQKSPGADWSGWSEPYLMPWPDEWYLEVKELALARKGDGMLLLIARSTDEIAVIPQRQPTGVWGFWSLLDQSEFGPAGGICACAQDSGGVWLWGIHVHSIATIWSAGSQEGYPIWGNWQIFPDDPPAWFQGSAAADQNDGCIALFGFSDCDLWTVGQSAPGGSWGKWKPMTPPPLN